MADSGHARWLGPNVRFLKVKSVPEGPVRVKGMNSARANELPQRPNQVVQNE